MKSKGLSVDGDIKSNWLRIPRRRFRLDETLWRERFGEWNVDHVAAMWASFLLLIFIIKLPFPVITVKAKLVIFITHQSFPAGSNLFVLIHSRLRNIEFTWARWFHKISSPGRGLDDRECNFSLMQIGPNVKFVHIEWTNPPSERVRYPSVFIICIPSCLRMYIVHAVY